MPNTNATPLRKKKAKNEVFNHEILNMRNVMVCFKLKEIFTSADEILLFTRKSVK